jgi:c-di-GMP-binding flagellar brake protein YcgR
LDDITLSGNRRDFLMAGGDTKLLSDAIARNSALVLSLPSAGMLRNYKSRFLSEEPDGFWIESASGEKPLIGELLATRQPVGVAFRCGPNKVLFTVPIQRLDVDHAVNAEMRVEALLLAMPEEVKTIQRRTHYRVRVWPDSDLTARMWRIAEHVYLGDRPLATQEVKAELRDISLGGLGVTLRPRDGSQPKITAGQRLRIELKCGEMTLLLDGHVRNPTGEAAEGIRTGIAFKPLDNQLEGRQKLAQLARIVGDLQREEVRRVRRGA